jgi:uncharacterized protein YdeI (YjbR/CyaY-like superfamily)
MGSIEEPRFFKTQADWRRWLEKHHGKATELLVGFHKTASGKGGINHKQALDEALCFGWIDGRARGGEASWSIRFTPRRRGSHWSAINIKRIEELKAAGRVHPAGLAEYENRDRTKVKRYSSENRDAKLSPAQAKQFRANKVAWANFEKMPPSYKHPAIWWVVSAKQEATRERRLATLIEDSAAGRKLKHLTRPGAKR